MDILTGLSVIVIASAYLAVIIKGLLKARRPGKRGVANSVSASVSATLRERTRDDGFVIQDDYPPNLQQPLKRSGVSIETVQSVRH